MKEMIFLKSFLLKNKMNIFYKEDKTLHGFHYTSRETDF